MKTSDKIKRHKLRSKGTRTKESSEPLIKRKDVYDELAHGDLTSEDYETLGPINLANDLGDDEQIKYWEALGENTPGSEMEQDHRNIDESVLMEDFE